MPPWPLWGFRTGALPNSSCSPPPAHSLESAAEGKPPWAGEGCFWSVLEEQDTSITLDKEFSPRADSQEGKSSLLRVKSFDALYLQGILSQQPCPWPQAGFQL